MPIGIDPAAATIPLASTFQPVSETQSMSDAYTLAGQKQGVQQNQIKLDQQKQQANDAKTIQQYLANGGDIYSQEGLTKAVSDLKGKVSPDAYAKIVDGGQNFQANQLKLESGLAALSVQQAAGIQAKMDMTLQALAPVYDAYDSGWKKRLTDKGLDPDKAPAAEVQQAKQDALGDFNAAKAARLQQLKQQQVGGKPLMGDQFLQQYSQMGPDDTKNAIDQNKYLMDRMKAAQELKVQQSTIDKNEADAKAKNAAPPTKTRNRIEGNQEIQEEWNPATKAWEPIGKGPRFAKQVPGVTTINMGSITPAQANLHGEDFLKTVNPADANVVKALAEGRTKLSELSTRSGERDKYLKLVTQYDPEWDAGTASVNRTIETDFAKGKPAQSLQSINAVTEHMDLYRGIAKALDNGDIQLYNKYKNEFQKATGATLPNDLESAAPIVGTEVVKAILPGGGGVEERKDALTKWNASVSKKQVESQIDNVYLPLMKGQVDGLKQRYEASGKKDFYSRFLTTKAKKALNISDDGSDKPPTSDDDKAMAWAKANPNDPRAKKIMAIAGQ